ncbi:TylF/MycF/NovP-related O-methyltransferase [Roseospira navarrensis]|uniref:Class I SAM-dependent methyltransferase n=1 Tax=Roseospira navarrensis TaxID=140058 RepID=A0A7X1ZFD0_9PROT|nr:TylF/MycF/NovP-related O-methyltransferase [Roseospira navarrensis]MQX36377.1 hypothetical protein [Roseospira navarrensis]
MPPPAPPAELPAELPVVTAPRARRPRHTGRGRRMLQHLGWLPGCLAGRLVRAGILLEKIGNTLRFEHFWRRHLAKNPDVVFVPTFNKQIGKHPIWNVAINRIREMAGDGTILEFGTNNGGWLKYFHERLPEDITLVGFDCFEGLPESWDGLPRGAIKGYGLPLELWRDDPTHREQVLAEFRRTGIWPDLPQPNIRIESGLFAQSLPRFLADGVPQDIRLIHFDADLYISTRPVLDTICGQLGYRYLILFDEFYSVNHEFRAWLEFLDLYKLDDWRVLASSEDGSQVLIEVNTRKDPGRAHRPGTEGA